jgi:hypothetical protein
MSTDPTLVRFAHHVNHVMAEMDAGILDRHAALAALVSDALAASVAEDLDPDTADTFLAMATEWAALRARGLTADVLLTRDPVPDDLAALDDDTDGGA